MKEYNPEYNREYNRVYQFFYTDGIKSLHNTKNDMPLQKKSQRSYAVVKKITTASLFLQRNGLKPAFNQKLTFEMKTMTFLYECCIISTIYYNIYKLYMWH